MQGIRATLHQRFDDVALRFPDATALVDGDGPMSYAELRAAGHELARVLVPLCTDEDLLIAARLGRSRAAPVGFLGILAGGRGYVPIDPDYPRARRDHLLDDSGARLIVTDGVLESDEMPLAEVGGLTIAVRDTHPIRSRDDLLVRTAYVIYTSGSTGAPKGCVVGHEQVLALLDACAEVFDFQPSDVWTVSHSFSFDFSIWELWGALLNGSTAVVVPTHVARDPDALARLLDSQQVTVVSQTPSMFGFLVGLLSRHKRSLPHLRYAVLGGEAVNLQDARTWLDEEMAPNAGLINMYGITETTVHVTHAVLNTHSCRTADANRTPIGRPLPHLSVSLRDSAAQPVADGTPGEIWVSGSGVTSGYLGRPELTGERFVVDSSGGTPRRYYRSGDLAVRRADGTLDYIGRTDSQVKLRGHRVELGEVEAALATLYGVRSVACALQTNRAGHGILVAYLVDDSDAELTPRCIRAHLAQRLPVHMRPHQFKRVKAIPVTENGKLDRASLSTLPVLEWPDSPERRG
ncbi:amino acid adenylation domain-containing protein [Streptomyces sp. DK15]|uniref:amino acid adenylation domain-containing protein n=1 Tax=Streptomyces sp. DK15 TaxID=2957499 RepID=UPI0029BCA354|nr:amino acid adenylation domain-containing protein [Streptomyces sp. DK15]MDX2395110.1 amino acid adenylation domain-containing protein [Streptomyces sp. DK15]